MTYNFLNNGMVADFMSGEHARGDYATDLLQFGQIQIPNMQMGIMYKTNVSQNVLGIGYVQTFCHFTVVVH